MTTPSIDTLLRILSSQHYLYACPSVLRALLAAVQSSAHPPSGTALIQTLKFRLLASDITASLQPPANLCLPPTLPDRAPPSLTLPVDGIVVQVLDIIDLTSSRGDTLDWLEMAERGEAMRGREVVRLVPGDMDDAPRAGAEARESTRSMHKLLLEDAAGRRVWGFELSPVPGVKVGMNIGAKILLCGCIVARGVVMLTAATATVLGGKLDVLQKAWIEERKQRLKDEIEALKTG